MKKPKLSKTLRDCIKKITMVQVSVYPKQDKLGGELRVLKEFLYVLALKCEDDEK